VREEGCVVVFGPALVWAATHAQALAKTGKTAYVSGDTSRLVSRAEASVTGMTSSWKQMPGMPASRALMLMRAAMCPPAEKPPTAMRDASPPSFSAFSRTQRRAVQQSSIGTGYLCSGAER
jgi:hypothetical protein